MTGKGLILISLILALTIQVIITQTTPRSPCNCGYRREIRKSNGNEAGKNEFTYMSAIYDTKMKKGLCGATIISSKYVVTTITCVEELKIDNLVLLVGTNTLSDRIKPGPAAVYPLRNIMTPQYYYRNESDIAIVQTYDHIQFSLYVGPICLPFKYIDDRLDNKNSIILGWGKPFQNSKDNVLLRNTVSTIGNSECQVKLPEVNILESDICVNFEKKGASCQFGSGGSLILRDESTNRDYLTGLFIHNVKCANEETSVYTRVTSYLSWIRTMTPDAHYCTN
ncbi:PREDICTED: venom serine protease 34-like isoform X2 [Nicrophorus vespilloides]|uniref:Venom serine protease 34-like isoform X2 n=1 Tax=Nicrophorus vespilloides TaxID=110193 RepID=A0ABM1MI66_NICVS|nr:PREDICTED: venom serine protease 34-like isoform X2 [Nicrophorus vespilloides]